MSDEFTAAFAEWPEGIPKPGGREDARVQSVSCESDGTVRVFADDGTCVVLGADGVWKAPPAEVALTLASALATYDKAVAAGDRGALDTFIAIVRKLATPLAAGAKPVDSDAKPADTFADLGDLNG